MLRQGDVRPGMRLDIVADALAAKRIDR